jgi:hypothetical protein
VSAQPGAAIDQDHEEAVHVAADHCAGVVVRRRRWILRLFALGAGAAQEWSALSCWVVRSHEENPEESIGFARVVFDALPVEVFHDEVV